MQSLGLGVALKVVQYVRKPTSVSIPQGLVLACSGLAAAVTPSL
jgi:hypothetical protein